MAISGSKVKFVYVESGIAPSNPVDGTIYFIPESNSLYVGNKVVIDGKSTNENIDEIKQDILNIEDAISNPLSISITGSGPVLIGADYNENSNTLVLTKGYDEDVKIKWTVV